MDYYKLDLNDGNQVQQNQPQEQRPTLSWFEFLLNGDLLRDHINKPNPEPSATDLIEQFLSSSQNRETNAMPIVLSGSNYFSEEIKNPPIETKKVKALKLLALKVAAYLKWNLNVFEDKLPLSVQFVLFTELLRVCLNVDGAADVKYHLDLDYNNLTDEALFAIIVYHCWVIRAMMLRNFPVKLPKSITIPVPGQQNLSSLPIEHVIKIIQDTFEDSKIILNKIRTLNKDIVIPSMNSFDIPTEMKQESAHEWSNGVMVTTTELNCQICYDLGCMHFFNEDYSNAGEMFFAVKENLEKLDEEFKFCCIDNNRLKGYLKACAAILKKKLDTSDSSIEEQLQAVIADHYNGLIPILIFDNEKQEISLSYRSSLENEIRVQAAENSKLKGLYTEVAFCNIVRTVLEGKPNTSKFFHNLSNIDRSDTGSLLKVVKSALGHSNDKQKKYLKDFICGNEHLLSLLFDNDLTIEFSETELESFHPEKHKLGDIKNEMVFKRDFKGNLALQVGGLERDLLRSYDPKEINDVISKLYSVKAQIRKPLWKINTMWELPNPLNIKIPNLLSGPMQDFVYILVAKSRELTRLKVFEIRKKNKKKLFVVSSSSKNFNRSRQLLIVAEAELADNKSYYLSKLIKWEALLVDLLQDQTLQPHNEYNSDLIKKCRHCINSLYQEKDVPRPEIIEYCAAYLLTVQQWEFLSTCDFGRSSRFECVHFASILAKVCHEINANSGSRKAVKELWELILPIFTSNNNQQKRSSSGLTNVLQREVPHAIFSKLALNQFMEKVQNILPLSIMISCLAKLHNILKDDSNNNLFLEYSTPWPAVVSNSGAFYIKSVCESLSSLLNCTLRLFPNYPPFLKTMADLNYVLGYHAKCLKYYLEAGATSSDFFRYPVPRTIFDDQVYRRMIRCCSQLTYHTQAAILCQFLDEVDYMVAFKALQEKNCSDAMDAYYDYFWDVTILEFLVNLHTKHGELDKKQLALKVMGQTELNSSNSDDIKLEAANTRKRQFLRSLIEQCL